MTVSNKYNRGDRFGKFNILHNGILDHDIFLPQLVPSRSWSRNVALFGSFHFPTVTGVTEYANAN